MARRAKTVIDADGEDRRESGYYSTPSFVADFLAHKALGYRPNTRIVLDPCVGKGELTAPFSRVGIGVTGIDLVDRGAGGCNRFVQADFLELAAPASEEACLMSIPSCGRRISSLRTPLQLPRDRLHSVEQASTGGDVRQVHRPKHVFALRPRDH